MKCTGRPSRDGVLHFSAAPCPVCDAVDITAARVQASIDLAERHPEWGQRGTPHGLTWLVTSYGRTQVERYRSQYPHRVQGRIIDAGVDVGPFGWFVPSVDDEAYRFTPSAVADVLAAGVS